MNDLELENKMINDAFDFPEWFDRNSSLTIKIRPAETVDRNVYLGHYLKWKLFSHQYQIEAYIQNILDTICSYESLGLPNVGDKYFYDGRYFKIMERGFNETNLILFIAVE